MYPTRLRTLPDFDYTGPHRYSLTFCTYQRRSIFQNEEIVAVVVRQILRAAALCGIEIIAYCLMPDHLHLVVCARQGSDSLPAFVDKAKQLSGYYGKRATGQRIWQTGYFGRVIDETEDIRIVVAYVLRNPVRRQIVTDPRDYPHSGSSVMTREELFEYVRDFL
jgi:putative transposase